MSLCYIFSQRRYSRTFSRSNMGFLSMDSEDEIDPMRYRYYGDGVYL